MEYTYLPTITYITLTNFLNLQAFGVDLSGHKKVRPALKLKPWQLFQMLSVAIDDKFALKKKKLESKF